MMRPPHSSRDFVGVVRGLDDDRGELDDEQARRCHEVPSSVWARPSFAHSMHGIGYGPGRAVLPGGLRRGRRRYRVGPCAVVTAPTRSADIHAGGSCRGGGGCASGSDGSTTATGVEARFWRGHALWRNISRWRNRVSLASTAMVPIPARSTSQKRRWRRPGAPRVTAHHCRKVVADGVLVGDTLIRRRCSRHDRRLVHVSDRDRPGPYPYQSEQQPVQGGWRVSAEIYTIGSESPERRVGRGCCEAHGRYFPGTSRTSRARPRRHRTPFDLRFGRALRVRSDPREAR